VVRLLCRDAFEVGIGRAHLGAPVEVGEAEAERAAGLIGDAIGDARSA